MKEKEGFKKCPNCQKKTCLVIIQKETQDDFAEYTETCHACGYENIIYDQYAEITQQKSFTSKESLEAKKQLKKDLNKSNEKEKRKALKEAGLVKVVVFVRPESADEIKKLDLSSKIWKKPRGRKSK
jgi:hypothetical protein